MTVYFEIDTSVLVPSVLVEFRPSVSLGAVSPRRRVLVLSTALAGATGKLGEIIRTYSASEGEKWGKGGPIDAMVRRIYRRASSAEVCVLALAEDAAGSKAKVDVTFTGTATEAGTAEFLVAGRRMRVGVPSGTAAAAFATSVSAALNKLPDFPMTGTAATSVATFTAKWKGQSGSYLTVEVVSLPAGLTAAIAATAGTADPNAAAAMSVLQGVSQQFTQVVTDWTSDANLDLVEAELARRDTAPVGLGGLLYVGTSGSKGTMLTWASFRNSRLVCALACGMCPHPPWEIAAAVAAERAAVPKVKVSSLNAWLVDILPPSNTSQYLGVPDRNELLVAGLATLQVGGDGNVYVERLVTTKTEDVAANPDSRDRNVMDQEINGVVRLTLMVKGYQAFLGKILVSDTTTETEGSISPLMLRELLRAVILSDLAEYSFDPKASAESLVVDVVPENPNAWAFRCDFKRVKEAFGLFGLVEVS